MFWVGILYFAEGFPLGIFYDIFPVHFRQQGVALWEIGFMSLLGLAWSLKFLWAPAIDHYRHHRRWMFAVDISMAAVLCVFALYADFGPWVWFAIGLFTLASATNDIAIDGYTIEMLSRHEFGIANGLRIAFYRAGMLAAGFALILSDYAGWISTYLSAAGLLVLLGIICQYAPPEKAIRNNHAMRLTQEIKNLLRHPMAMLGVISLLAGALWLTDSAVHWSKNYPIVWWLIIGFGASLVAISSLRHYQSMGGADSERDQTTRGPMFGTLLDMLSRPQMGFILLFILIFKLGDSAMGFMIKPFWVDAGFSASQIGLVSVNLGLVLSIAGGITGGWITDRIGIFHGLWILGLFQAVSNLGYAWVASILPLHPEAGIPAEHMIFIYSASGLESFTGGLGTAAFLAFLMAIVNKCHSATEYALLSSVFALSRSVSGWAGGFGAEIMGYADYFLLTFFLSFPAYLLLPWVKKMLDYAHEQKDWGQR